MSNNNEIKQILKEAKIDISNIDPEIIKILKKSNKKSFIEGIITWGILGNIIISIGLIMTLSPSSVFVTGLFAVPALIVEVVLFIKRNIEISKVQKQLEKKDENKIKNENKYVDTYSNEKQNTEVKTNEMTTNNKIERLKQIRDDLTAQPKEEQTSKQKTKK